MRITDPLVVTVAGVPITYDIQKVSPEDTIFSNRSGGNSQTMKTISYKFSPSSAARRTDKFGIDLDIPLVRNDPVKGNYAIDVARGRVQLTVPETASAAEREEIYVTLSGAIAELLFANSVKNFDLPT